MSNVILSAASLIILFSLILLIYQFCSKDNFFMKILLNSYVTIHIIALLIIFSIFLNCESLVDIALIYALTNFIVIIFLPNLAKGNHRDNW